MASLQMETSYRRGHRFKSNAYPFQYHDAQFFTFCGHGKPIFSRIVSLTVLSLLSCGSSTTATNLTNYNRGKDMGPDWSCDGTRLTFISNRDGNHEIYTMDINDSNLINPTKHTAEGNVHNVCYGACCPDWSPDGTRIAFASNRDGNIEIYVMDVEEQEGSAIPNLLAP